MNVCLYRDTFPTYNAGTTRAVIYEEGGDVTWYKRTMFKADTHPPFEPAPSFPKDTIVEEPT